jgi:hypothetical protein
MSGRQERDARYNRSEKGKARHARYNASGKGWQRQQRYDNTAAGMRRKIRHDIEVRGRDEEWIWDGPRGDELREREEYEASGSTLSFVDWLNEVYPLPRLRKLW